MKITLAKALKLKNKMVANLRKLAERIVTNNSYKDTNKPSYDSRASLKEYEEAMNKLIALKVAINTANVKLADPLLRIGELKTKIMFLRSMNTTQGLQTKTNYRDSATVAELYVANFPELEVDKMVETLEVEIDTLQDKIDYFNATTEIEL